MLTTIAAEMSLRDGVPHQAGASDLEPVASLRTFAEGWPWHTLPGFDEVTAMMAAAPDGARGLVVTWHGAGDQPDHAFNVVKDPGLGVVFLDGQTGREAVLPGGPGAVEFAAMTDGIPGPLGAREPGLVAPVRDAAAASATAARTADPVVRCRTGTTPLQVIADAADGIRGGLEGDPRVLPLGSAGPLAGRHERPDIIWRVALRFLRDNPDTALIRHVQDIVGDQATGVWRRIELPAEVWAALEGRHTSSGRVVVHAVPRPVGPADIRPVSERSDLADVPHEAFSQLCALAVSLVTASRSLRAAGQPMPATQIVGYSRGSYIPGRAAPDQTGRARALTVQRALRDRVREELASLPESILASEGLTSPAAIARRVAELVPDSGVRPAAGSRRQTVITVHPRTPAP